MQKISERDIRGAIRNCSRGERDTMTLPKLDTVNWDDLEYLGWRDAKAPLRGYLVHVPADEPVGIAVRGSASRVRRTALCDLCHCVHQDGVALYVAPRAGQAGRNGNTTGLYICDDLACSSHLRAAIKPTRQMPDPAPLVAARGAELRARLTTFITGVLRSDA
jgi:hypothetical protein